MVRGLAVGLILAALIIPPADSDSDRAATASAGIALSAVRVTAITDSVGGVLYWSESAREALSHGLDLKLETKTCRKLVSPGCEAYDEVPPSALETVERLGPELGSLVVVDVGYNDLADGYASGLDMVMTELARAGVQHVVWVTLRESIDPWVRINAQIRDAPRRWPQLVVADWAVESAEQPVWFVDGVHMNEVGGAAFARFLRSIVLDVCGGLCALRVPPVPPVATLRSVDAVGRIVTVRWWAAAAATTYDVAVRETGGSWRTAASRLVATSYRLPTGPGRSLWVRIRARDEANAAGPWSVAKRVRT